MTNKKKEYLNHHNVQNKRVNLTVNTSNILVTVQIYFLEE